MIIANIEGVIVILDKVNTPIGEKYSLVCGDINTNSRTAMETLFGLLEGLNRGFN